MFKQMYLSLPSHVKISSVKNSSNNQSNNSQRGAIMNIRTEKDDKVSCDLLVVGMFENEPNSHTKAIDTALNNEVTSTIKRKEFVGENGQLKMISTLGKLPSHKVLLVGLG